MASPVVNQVYELINPLKVEFEQVCAEPSINFKRESEFAMQIFANNDYLAKTAMNNTTSNAAALRTDFLPCHHFDGRRYVHLRESAHRF